MLLILLTNHSHLWLDPKLDTDELELELPTIPALPANTQATEALHLVSNDPKVAVVNSVRSSIATSGQGISNNTIAQTPPRVLDI